MPKLGSSGLQDGEHVTTLRVFREHQRAVAARESRSNTAGKLWPALTHTGDPTLALRSAVTAQCVAWRRARQGLPGALAHGLFWHRKMWAPQEGRHDR